MTGFELSASVAEIGEQRSSDRSGQHAVEPNHCGEQSGVRAVELRQFSHAGTGVRQR